MSLQNYWAWEGAGGGLAGRLAPRKPRLVSQRWPFLNGSFITRVCLRKHMENDSLSSGVAYKDCLSPLSTHLQCTYMWMCVCRCTHLWVHVWKLGVKIGCFALLYLSLLLEIRSLIASELALLAGLTGQWAPNSQDSSFSVHLISGVIGMYHDIIF